MKLGFVLALFLALGAFLAVASPASATLLVYEPFDYPTGTLSGANGGTGFLSGWTTTLGPGNVTAGSLAVAGYQGIGNKVQSAASTASLLARRNLSDTYGATDTDLWASFLVRVDSLQNFAGLEFYSASSDLFVGRLGGVVPSSTWGMDTAGGTGRVLSSVPVVFGQTALLVVHLQFLSGPDRMDLYVNPATPSPPPVADATKTDLDLLVSQSIMDVSTGSVAFDEIRMGTTYADVVPVPVPEPSSIAMCFYAIACGVCLSYLRPRVSGPN